MITQQMVIWILNSVNRSLMSSANRARLAAALRIQVVAFVLCCLGVAGQLVAQDSFLENIRTSDPLTPKEELSALHVPDGFEIQLVASEPQIGKPLNMAFDVQGRLWITDTVEYPYPVEDGAESGDTIKILEDKDGDGFFETVTVFAENLNIPMGLYPYRNGCIAFSIPNIWWLEDRDGDGKSDHREILYGPMGWERDTHGLNNSFRRGFDGWLYACHGFNNETSVAGQDGHRIEMNSGNTYRMKLSGGRIEHFTWGQVNPFGMVQDEWGRLFSADCHSKPIYELLQGGRYPSFGKPHDGLGFVEPMMEHLHGSTAIAGLAIWQDERVPVDFQNHYFSGNVMTSRVNRNRVEWQGATPRAIQQEDFVISDDSWFRPVDIQLGPDGALYIADFYNRIIGHYEIPLEHAGRDRKRGRIFRVIPTAETKDIVSQPLEDATDSVNDQGPKKHGLASPSEIDLTKMTDFELIATLERSNLTLRMLAMNYLHDSVSSDNVETRIRLLEEALTQSDNSIQQSHCLWLLHRLGVADSNHLAFAFRSNEELLRVHAAKVLGAKADWKAEDQELARVHLFDNNPLVSREIATALSTHDATERTLDLVKLGIEIGNSDPHQSYMVKRALLRQLNPVGEDVRSGFEFIKLSSGTVQSATGEPLDRAAWGLLAEVSLGVPSQESASFLLQGLRTGHELSREEFDRSIRHVARYCSASSVPELVAIARQRLAGQTLTQVEILNSIKAALDAAGEGVDQSVNRWASELSEELLTEVEPLLGAWYHLPIAGKSSSENPWRVERRRSADGEQNELFLSTLPSGEQQTGVLRSKVFSAPATFSFYCAGHIGNPSEELLAQNAVQLIDAETGGVLRVVRPPRNDVAQQIAWDLSDIAGRRVRLELVDGDQRGAYAWLAVGRFSSDLKVPAVASPQQLALRLNSAIQLASGALSETLKDKLAGWLNNFDLDVSSRTEIVRALLVGQGRLEETAFLPVIEDPSVSEFQRQRAIEFALADDSNSLEFFAREELFRYPATAQVSFCRRLLSMSDQESLFARLVSTRKLDSRVASDPQIVELVAAAEEDELQQTWTDWVATLPPPSEARQQAIDQGAARMEKMFGNSNSGALVFKQRCQTCHQLDGIGSEIGPQLDGIGNRGEQRMLEDVLDPNRNVDLAFRTSTIVTIDGRSLNGLWKRDEGQSMVFVDQNGKEFRVQREDVEELNVTRLSLMPADILAEVSEQEFVDLFTFLLEQTAAH